MKKLIECEIEGLPFRFFDSEAHSFAVSSIIQELPDYQITKFNFQPGDSMIDIGAHCGVVSIAVAKIHPEITVHAYEPNPSNFQTLKANLAENQVENVIASRFAISADGRDLRMRVKFKNTGSGSAFKTFDKGFDAEYTAPSLTLDQVLQTLSPLGCRLLKLDCEGAEHEIILHSKLLPMVGNVVGELHMNPTLEAKGYSISQTAAHTRRVVSGLVHFKRLRMVD